MFRERLALKWNPFRVTPVFQDQLFGGWDPFPSTSEWYASLLGSLTETTENQTLRTKGFRGIITVLHPSLLGCDDIYTRKLWQKPHDAPPLNQLSQPDVLHQHPLLSVPAAMSDVWGAVCVLADHTWDSHSCIKKTLHFRKAFIMSQH